jgi:tetratricopeptide (TPR) repeat protein
VKTDWNARRKLRREEELREQNALIKSSPGVWWHYKDRGIVFARGGQFVEAADDFAKAIELEPQDHFTRYLNACLLACLDRKDAYRANRTAILQGFADSPEHDVAERSAKSSLLLPIGADELKQATTRIDFALSPGGGINIDFWYPLAKGMAEYRAGETDPPHLQTALEWFDRAKKKNTSSPYLASADFYAAMAHHRLNHPAEAKLAFEAALRRMEAEVPVAGVGDLADGGVENWLICQVARREAESMLNVASTKPTTHP